MLDDLERYLPLVEAAAEALARRAPRTLDVGDCASAGWDGLVRAAETFDPAQGPFPPYARTCIGNAIRDRIRLERCQIRTSRRRLRLVEGLGVPKGLLVEEDDHEN